MKPLFVTKSFLPPLSEYISYLKKIWKSGVLTNDGPMIKEFEQKFASYSGSKNVMAVGNGTLALQLAIRALDLKGEIITTPFSFVATSSSIIWENCKPVFADIDHETLNINPDEIRKKINKKTAGVLAVHVYGSPCDVDEIGNISKKHNIPVIYDACHTLGVKFKGKSLFRYGDISVTSLHATKIINTAEGGVLFTENNKTAEKIRLLRNFGYRDYKIHTLGINAKMSELNAALGIASFMHINEIYIKRKNAFNYYRMLLKNNGEIRYQKFNGVQNFAYYPVIFNKEKIKKAVIKELNSHNIFPREYFSPSLEYVYDKKITCPIAYDISKRILCLPLSSYTKNSEILRITKIINAICRG